MRQRKTALTAALFFTAVSLLFLPPAVAGGNEAQGFLIVARDTIEQQKPPAVMLQIINAKAPDEDSAAAGEAAAERDAGLLSPSGLTAAELEAGLLGNLKPYAAAFVAAERETGINAVFLAAVAALESGWNTSTVAENKNNLFGWSAATGYADFESKEDCIAEVAGFEYAAYIRISKAMMDECAQVCFLPDWKDSNGAMYEYGRAAAQGKPFFFFEQWHRATFAEDPDGE